MTPRKLNKALVELIVQCRKDGLNLTQSCEAADITLETLLSWRKKGRKDQTGLCFELDNRLTAIADQIRKEKDQRLKAIYERKVRKLQAKYNQANL